MPESKQAIDERAEMKRALAGQSEKLTALDHKVTAIDQKLADKAAEASKPIEPPGWSCAARCATTYSCTNNGKSSLKWKNISSHAVTASAAFKQLVDKCDDAPFLSGQCREGVFVYEDASIVNACVRE